MSKTPKTRASSIGTSFANALLIGGMLIFGGCVDADGALPAETASSQQALQPTSPGADVWRANLGVTIAATKDPVAKTVSYVFETANQGDDDARLLVFAAHFGPGVTVTSVNTSAFDSCTAPAKVGNGSSYIQCTRSSLGVRAKLSLSATVSNPTNGTTQASAQVFNLSPDPIVDNNYSHLWVP